MCVSQSETSCPVKSMPVTSPSHFTTKWSWLSWLGLRSSSVFGPLSNPITSFTTPGRRDLFPPCSEESTPSVGTLPARSVASLANCVRLLALPSPLRLSLSLDQMALAAQQNTISTWPSVFSVDSAKKHAQLMLLLRDQTSNILHFCMRNLFTIKKNFLRMEINGSHNLQES